MKYQKDQIIAMAKVCLKDKKASGQKYKELVMYISAITGMSESEVERKIEEFAEGVI